MNTNARRYNNMTLPPILSSPSSIVSISRLLSSSPPPPSQQDLTDDEIGIFPSPSFGDSAFDVATLSLISGLVLLSLLSLSFILRLRLRSPRLQHLENFNSLSTTRLLLVTFASFWAVNEVLRLTIFRRYCLYPFLPSLTLNQQADFCKLYVVSSFGLFQPGFLVTLLLLINLSIQKKNPHQCMCVLASVCVICSPLLILQIFFDFFSPLEAKFPNFMHETSVISTDIYGNKTVFCTYPLFSCIIFGAFAVVYSLAFFFSCWRVASLVINKSMRARIDVLNFTVMTAVPVQILCFGISAFWFPQDPFHGCVALLMFLAAGCCVAVAEVILVIRPIKDALAACDGHCQSRHGVRLTEIEVYNNDPIKTLPKIKIAYKG